MSMYDMSGINVLKLNTPDLPIYNLKCYNMSIKQGLLMENKICQSCAMPLTPEDMYATEKDGSKNEDYCKWCYKDGEFLDQCSMEEYIEKCSQFGEQAGMTNEQMKEYCTKIFPTLKRWKQA